jgi:hypothetical protein
VVDSNARAWLDGLRVATAVLSLVALVLAQGIPPRQAGAASPALSSAGSAAG